MPKSPINETSNKDTIAEPPNSAAPSATKAPASAYTVGYGRPPLAPDPIPAWTKRQPKGSAQAL